MKAQFRDKREMLLWLLFLCRFGEEVSHLETLCVKNLQIYAQNPIVKGIDFTVERGQRLAIVGESGCGKTMTAMAIFGLLPEGCRAKGEILLEGQDLLKAKQIARGKELVLIPQSGIEFLDPVFRIRH